MVYLQMALLLTVLQHAGLGSTKLMRCTLLSSMSCSNHLHWIVFDPLIAFGLLLLLCHKPSNEVNLGTSNIGQVAEAQWYMVLIIYHSCGQNTVPVVGLLA